VLQGPGPTAVVATLDPCGYGANTHPNGPLLPPRTLAAAAFALAFAAGSSALAEVWREARILRPPRPEPPQATTVQEEQEQQQQQRSPRAAMIAQLEAARDHYAREEARLLRQDGADEPDLKERLQEARVVRAALERQVAEQRALLRREEKAAARRRAAAA
jgi:hypothetical protein